MPTKKLTTTATTKKPATTTAKAKSSASKRPATTKARRSAGTPKATKRAARKPATKSAVVKKTATTTAKTTRTRRPAAAKPKRTTAAKAADAPKTSIPAAPTVVTLPNRVPMRLQEKTLVLTQLLTKDMHGPFVAMSRFGGFAFVFTGVAGAMTTMQSIADGTCISCGATAVGAVLQTGSQSGSAFLAMADAPLFVVSVAVVFLGLLLLWLSLRLQTQRPVVIGADDC